MMATLKHSRWSAVFAVVLLAISVAGITRSVMVPARGSQAFGSAQSYALKQFMRSLFQIPTGDKEDADFAVPTSVPQTIKRGTAR